MAGKVQAQGKGKKQSLRISSSDFLDENPLAPSSSSSKEPPKKAMRKEHNDDFLDESVEHLLKQTVQKTAPSAPSSTSTTPTSTPPKNPTQLRRSLSSDDDFLSIDLFSASKKDTHKLKEEKVNQKDGVNDGTDDWERKRLKTRLGRELSHAVPHLNGVWKGSIQSELADKYNKGGKDRKGLKWALSTGGFSEDEFDLIIELLHEHFPQCDLHYVTDVLWQEAAVQILMERNKLKSHKNAERILKAVELSSVDRQELRRYQSDSSLLTTVTKYQEMIDSPLSTPNSSQEKKRSKSKSPSSSQEKPASQERKPRSLSASNTFPSSKPSVSKAQAPTSSFIPDTPQVDLTKVKFTKQHITSNNGSYTMSGESSTTVLTTTTTVSTIDDDEFLPSKSPSSSTPSSSSKNATPSNLKLATPSPTSPTKTSSPKKPREGLVKNSDWLQRKVRTPS